MAADEEWQQQQRSPGHHLPISSSLYLQHLQLAPLKIVIRFTLPPARRPAACCCQPRIINWLLSNKNNSLLSLISLARKIIRILYISITDRGDSGTKEQCVEIGCPRWCCCCCCCCCWLVSNFHENIFLRTFGRAEPSPAQRCPGCVWPSLAPRPNCTSTNTKPSNCRRHHCWGWWLLAGGGGLGDGTSLNHTVTDPTQFRIHGTNVASAVCIIAVTGFQAFYRTK